MTHVETTTGPVPDGNNTERIHAALKQRELLPKTHLVDTGFLDAELLVTSQEQYGIDLYGPTRQDYHWQAQAGTGFAAEYFQVDWERREVTCPAGKTSESWSPVRDRRGNEVVKVKFSSSDCGPCPHLSKCVRSKKPYPRRNLSLRHEPHYKALVAARQRERTAAFHHEYHRRAGIEGTLSRGIRATRLRRTRYIGLRRVRLGHILTGLGLNALRLGEWLLGMERPRTRVTPFMRLMAGAASA